MKHLSGKRIGTAVVTAGILLAAGALLCFPAAAADGARRGIGYCLNLLIPSLFPFMVLSAYLVKSGTAGSLGRFFAPVTRFLFRLPGSAAAAVFLSFIGGYPVGARAVAALRAQNEITEKEAQRMLCFCVNSGPAFVISSVGCMMLGDLRAGFILFVSQILASLLLGIACRFTLREEESGRSSPQKPERAVALVASVSDASRGMVAMCAFVVLFAVLVSLLLASGTASAFSHFLLSIGVPRAAAECLLSAVLEVTGGCMDAIGAGVPLLLISFIIGWGGLCVHFQVLSAASQIRISRLRFTLFRFLHGVLAAFFTNLFLRFYPTTISVFSSTSQPLTYQISGSAPAACALFLLCVTFLLTIQKFPIAKKEIKNNPFQPRKNMLK